MWRVGSQHPGPSGRVRLQPQQRQANDDLLALIGWRHGVPTTLSMATNTEDPTQGNDRRERQTFEHTWL